MTLVDEENRGLLDLTLNKDATGQMALQLRARSGAEWVPADPVSITNQSQEVSVLWQVENLNSTNPGRAELWVGGSLAAQLAGLNNRAATAKMIRLGANYGAGGGIQGHLDFDAYDTWTYRD